MSGSTLTEVVQQQLESTNPGANVLKVPVGGIFLVLLCTYIVNTDNYEYDNYRVHVILILLYDILFV